MANSFKSAITKITTTNATTVFTVPTGASVTVIGLSVTNNQSVDQTISVTLTRGSTTVNLVAPNTDLPTKATIVLLGSDQKMVFMSGDILQVQMSASNGGDVILSYLEMI